MILDCLTRSLGRIKKLNLLFLLCLCISENPLIKRLHLVLKQTKLLLIRTKTGLNSPLKHLLTNFVRSTISLKPYFTIRY